MIGIYLQSLVRETTSAQGADVSAVSFLGPILVFLVVVIVLTAILTKIKILGENIWVNVFVSLFIAGIFVVVDSIRDFLLNVIPWFAVLLMAIFFILVLATFINADDVPGKFLIWVFLIVMIVVFVIVGVKVFAGSVVSYLPGNYYSHDADPEVLVFTNWFYSPSIFGAFWLIITAIVVSIVLVKFGGA